MRRAAMVLVILASLFAGSQIACSQVTTYSESIYIPGSGTTDEKLALAQKIGGEVWQSGLQSQVKTAFPSISAEQLSGVFIRWETVTVTPVSGSETSSTGVRIRTGVDSRGDLDDARAIASLCGDIVESAVSSAFPGLDIYRLDSTEQRVGL